MGKFGIKHGMQALRSLAVVAACAATVVAAPVVASASTGSGLVNPGFEAGNSSGWSGSALVTSQYAGYTAPDGHYFAMVTGGCPTDTLSQSFTAHSGQILTGWSFFKANDYLPYNDSGSVQLSVTGAGTAATVFTSSINQVGSYGETPWQQWSYTAPADGQYTIRISSSNASDCANSSVIGIDLRSDTTAPTISASATSNGSPYTSGTWTNHDVTVHYTCADEPGGSGVASVTPDQVVSTDGEGQSVTGSCTDNAGNTASASFTGIRIDTAAPVVTFNGNAGTYGVDEQVSITCSTADSLSGVVSSACADTAGPAYTFGLGSHTLTAGAIDNAGNEGSGTTTFNVLVTPTGLCNLAAQFSTNSDVASGLCDKITAASQAAARGQAKPRANILSAFDHQVSAQTGKALTSQQAEVLTRLSTAL